mmetsp:Transcript_11760/g.18046  ORF Transcript_11760/g.18046 Transcript_11760/m.18046 type:complete len:298 (+) Transcript_11760:285-1178(+)|eukprot:CAMPEP_0201733944 /NCGR_PEP_ID=MMETSP0593-20130828/32861_1 /ASSEMBLY_ACC=CAM_ASM_000672 /TAXON_ID=267983 /ORGANISM="Skeletonema japonicum, Strain CCMP2506" /LENGTH=297 /DNA_ID=CAMNT_0048227195 /DNA_START=229 /DNA_END=1122 /DNA_ORIENTATION=+
MRITAIALSSILPTTVAFTSKGPVSMQTSTLAADAVAIPPPEKTIFDPLGLYSANSPERLDGLIKPLESSSLSENKEILDPLRLYSDQSEISGKVETSAALPFLPRPALLDGSLPGDRGFDPFNFASDANSLQWQRKSELKHGRLAMLAAVGWPMAELMHKNIADAFDLSPLLASNDRVPSILNDGLSHAHFPAFWIATIAVAAALEISESVAENVSCKLDPTDYGFDPLNFFGGKTDGQKRFLQEAEVFNGRLGMLAIVGFAAQEFVLESSVVDQVPIFFKPLNIAFEQLMTSGAM